jgi:DMSO/TMAO reductase YedYZ molybdopterin-dependent catalytic subunit
MLFGRQGVAIGCASSVLPRLSRRGFLSIVAGTGVAMIPVVASRSLSLPNETKDSDARTRESALDPNWRLSISRGSKSICLSALDLDRFPKSDFPLPMSGKGKGVAIYRWRGVLLRDLVAAVGGTMSERLKITSLDKKVYEFSLGSDDYAEETTLVALELAGRRLDFERGYPAVLITPGRSASLDTKWLSSIEILS